MAMSWIYTAMLLLAVLAGAINGQMGAVSSAVLTGARQAAELVVALAGPLCLWSGLAALLEKSGLAAKQAKLLAPLLGRLFPQTARDDTAMRHLTGNFTANLLGLGNAATPLGIAAVQRMKRFAPPGEASDEMCRLIVMNTASVQLIPATVAALRAANGAPRPFCILPAVWFTSVCSVAAGLAAAYLFSRWRR